MFSSKEFKLLRSRPDRELLRLISKKALAAKPSSEFVELSFEDGLLKLGDMATKVLVHDQSVSTIEVPGSVRPATLGEVLDSALSDRSKIFTFRHRSVAAPPKVTGHSTSAAAYVATQSWANKKHEFHDLISRPRHNRFSQVSTTGAINYWSLPPGGYLMKCKVSTGRIWVVFARPMAPRFNSFTKRFLAHIGNESTSQSFSRKCGQVPGSTIECFIAEAGFTFIIPSNCLYLTHSLANTVMDSEYFYSCGSFRSSFFGAVHSFVMGPTVTPMSCLESQDEQVKLMHFAFGGLVRGMEIKSPRLQEHIPVISDLSSIVDVFSLAHMNLFSNALAPGTYDSSDLPTPSRQWLCIGRGMALSMIKWLSTSYVVTRLKPPPPPLPPLLLLLLPPSPAASSPESSVEVIDLSQVWRTSVTTLAVAIYWYKRSAEDEGHRGNPGCTSQSLLNQLRACVELVDSTAVAKFDESVREPTDSTPDNLDWSATLGDLEAYSVRQSATLAWKDDQGNFFQEGQTALDRDFFKAVRTTDGAYILYDFRSPALRDSSQAPIRDRNVRGYDHG
ncbi:hypothetical protein MD484_g7894, partial [Candolleomyces efflorescens]